jgi:hypothetical protein
MRIVALAKKLNNARYLTRILEQEECQRSDSSASDIVRSVRNGDVEKFADSVVVGSSGIRKC